MALNFTFVPNTTQSAKTGLTVEEIPEDVRKDCEEVYAALKSNPNGRMRVEFEDKTKALQWIAVATAYCAVRPDGPVRFRKSPTRNLPDNVIEFRIADIPKDGTAEIREAAAALNAQAEAAPTPTPAKAGKK